LGIYRKHAYGVVRGRSCKTKEKEIAIAAQGKPTQNFKNNFTTTKRFPPNHCGPLNTLPKEWVTPEGSFKVAIGVLEGKGGLGHFVSLKGI